MYVLHNTVDLAYLCVGFIKYIMLIVCGKTTVCDSLLVKHTAVSLIDCNKPCVTVDRIL